MKSSLRLGTQLLLVFALLFTNACSSKSKKIVGRWQSETNKPWWSEYFSDGTVTISTGDRSQSGTYKFIEDGRLKIQMGADGVIEINTFNVSFQGDKLTFTDAKGNEQIYHRQTSADTTNAKTVVEKQVTRNEKPDFTTTAKDLRNEFRSNQITFNTKYKGKTIRLSGVVNSIKEPGVVELWDDPFQDGVAIFCGFDDLVSLATLEAHCPATFSGVYEGTEQGLLVLTHCGLQ